MKKVNSEDPNHHWEFVNVKNKRVLDLGCGDFGGVGHLPYTTTLEYFLIKEAAFVLGVDANSSDLNAIKQLENRYSNFNVIESLVSSPDQIKDLIINNNIQILKSDIEGHEINLFNLDNETFTLIEEYYIETHSDDLYNQCINKLTNCGYDIYNQIALVQTNEVCKVIFARKK